MSTLVLFHLPFPFKLAIPFFFQLSSKRMPLTYASNASNTSPMHFYLPFHFQLVFPFSFQLPSKHMPQMQAILVHTCAISLSFYHPRSIPMRHALMHASLASPLALWHMPLMNIKTRECGHHFLPHLHYDACLWRI